MRKWLIAVIIIIVLIVAFVLRMNASQRKEQREEVTQALPVEVTMVTKGAVISTCEVLGTILADKTAQVFPETMGRILRVLVKEGSYVNKNDNIIAMRNETVGYEYEEGYIKSPISGNVGKIMVDVGSMVTPQAPVAVIVDYSRVKIEFHIAEVNAGCVVRNQEVKIVVDGIAQNFAARVSEISPVIDPMTRTASVKAITANSKRLLKPGMTARVQINLGEETDVLRIPKDALLDSYLFVVTDSTAERRDVKLGLIGDEYTAILEGIRENEQVIVVGQQRLAGGEKVNPIARGE
ncbi:MAG: efflux RND transporter periplasmic adaptor subunit [bacterium]